MGVMEEIAEKIQSIVAEIFDTKIDVDVKVAPEGQKVGGKQAEFATNVCMQLAGILKMNPREVAEQIMSRLRSDEKFDFEVEIAGPGFLNFIARDEYWKRILANMRANFKKSISCDVYSGQTVVCEFSDPNPFKVLHVGHLYTSIVGDSISRLVEFAGGKVVRANFGGDVGLHVAKNMYAIRKKLASINSSGSKEVSKKKSVTDFVKDMSKKSYTEQAEFLGNCYVEGTRAYDDDEVAKKEITRLNAILFEISGSGEDKKWNDIEYAEIATIYWWGRNASYEYFKDFYAKIGLVFDKYYPESAVAGRGLREVEAQIGKVYKESNGAVVFEGEPYGLHTRVFINTEGLPTYETKDVGLLFTKWDDYKFDQSVVITGNEQLDYMKVVLKSVEQYAPELVEKTKHLTHGMVRLPGNAKMSSRKGNFIKAVDVLEEVEALVERSASSEDALLASGHASQGASARGTISTARSGAPSSSHSISTRASMVPLAAIKYAFLKYKIGGNIEFDAKECVSTTGNSGVYLQYSAVRAKKVLSAVSSSSTGARWELNEHEKKLIRKLAQYKYVLEEAVRDLMPNKLAGYLFETAQEFSRFYEKVKVAGSEYEAERAQIVATYLDVMTHGLNLFGIEVPEEM